MELIQGANYKTVLAEAIRSGYAELFAVYPDANLRTNAELSHVFSTSSSAGAQVISKTVTTFKAIVEEADFSGTTSLQSAVEVGPLHTPPGSPPLTPPQAQSLANFGGGPAVHIDIQIHISPDSSSQQIEKIFESMAKHLYGRKAD